MDESLIVVLSIICLVLTYVFEDELNGVTTEE